MEGRGYGDDEKGVEVADNVNEGIAETVFDRDCEPRRRGSLATQRADAAQVEWFNQLQRVSSHSHPVFSIRSQRRQMPALSRVVAQ